MPLNDSLKELEIALDKLEATVEKLALSIIKMRLAYMRCDKCSTWEYQESTNKWTCQHGVSQKINPWRISNV